MTPSGGHNGRPEVVDLQALLHRPGPGNHRTTIELDGQAIETLADLPPARGGLLFVGLNPSTVSVHAGHYHQGRLGRLFWRRLIKAGILPAGTDPLWQKVALWRPGAVVFVYKRGASIAAARPLPQRWGQLQGVAIGGRPCFLMPGPYAPASDVGPGLNLLRNLNAALPD
jgi:hypothetical protein